MVEQLEQQQGGRARKTSTRAVAAAAAGAAAAGATAPPRRAMKSTWGGVAVIGNENLLGSSVVGAKRKAEEAGAAVPDAAAPTNKAAKAIEPKTQKAKRGKCEHNLQKRYCKDCDGSALCAHNREKRRCRDCGDWRSYCPHNRLWHHCRECRPDRLCEHNVLNKGATCHTCIVEKRPELLCKNNQRCKNADTPRGWTQLCTRCYRAASGASQPSRAARSVPAADRVMTGSAPAAAAAAVSAEPGAKKAKKAAEKAKKDQRARVLSAWTELSMTEMSKVIGAKWKELSPEEKKPFEEEKAAKAENLALMRLQRVSAQLDWQRDALEQLEQDHILTQDEVDAERLSIGNERSAASTTYRASLRRIEAGEVEAELAALVVDLERLERVSAQLDWQRAVVEQLRTLARKEGGVAAGK